MNEKLQSVVDSLPIIGQLFSDKKFFLTVFDTDSVVMGYWVPNGVSPRISVGEVFRDPTGVADEVMRRGVAKHNILPPDYMGEAFEGNVVPIMDGGKAVGCVTCTYSVESSHQMKDMTGQFRESIKNIYDSLQSVITGTEKIFNTLDSMNEMTSGVEADVNGAVEVVNKISGNASHSNILALNASIEAARSGEAGRGFAVVATEMGKLAKDSGSSAAEIKSTLDDIIHHLGNVITSIKSANEVAKEHMENTNMIKSVLEETMAISEKLEAEMDH